MKGSNVLILNSATVIEALQEYFDKRTVETGLVTVTSITIDTEPSSPQLRVVTNERAKPKPLPLTPQERENLDHQH